MTSNDNMDEEVEDLKPLESNCQFPDILSKEELETILKKFTVLRTSHEMSREEMVAMFNRFIVPLPQRVQLRRLQHLRIPKEISKLNSKIMAGSSEASENASNDCNRKKETRIAHKRNIDEEMPKNVINMAKSQGSNSKKPIKLKRKFNKVSNSSCHPKEQNIPIDEIEPKKTEYEKTKETLKE